MSPWFAGRILSVNEALAERWGSLTANCELQGTPLNSIDGFIAATALVHDLTLVTRNTKDFAELNVTHFNPWIDSL